MLYVLFPLMAPGYAPETLESFLMFTPLVAIIVVLVSAAKFLIIEHPAILFGKRHNILAWLNRPVSGKI